MSAVDTFFLEQKAVLFHQFVFQKEILPSNIDSSLKPKLWYVKDTEQSNKTYPSSNIS